MAHVRTDAGPVIAGTSRRLMSLELPRKWWQWMIAVVLAIIIVFTGLFLSGMHTGRLGFVPVEGNSMQSVFPWGTAVFVIPVKPRDGDYVVGWGMLENPETNEDQEPTLMVKKLVGNGLVSLDNNEHSTDFKLRGVVIGQLPIQKICWWLDKGTQKPAPRSMTRVTTEQKIASYRNALEAECKANKLLAGQRARAIPCSNSPTHDGNLKTSVVLPRGKPLVIKPHAGDSKHIVLWAQSDDEIWVNGQNTGIYSGQWCHKELEVDVQKGVTIEVRQQTGKMAPPGAIIAEIVFLQ